MTKVFIGGSRRVSRLNADVKQRLDRIIAKRLPVLIGDANGADKAVQAYLRDKQYEPVEVFCSAGVCRNNLGDWPTRSISAPASRRDFAFYAWKDQAMASEADYGFMIWDGESKGTLMNAPRLIRHGKGVVLYSVPAQRFHDLKSEADWAAFVAQCRADLRERVEQEWRTECLAAKHEVAGPQPGAIFIASPDGAPDTESTPVLAGASAERRADVQPVGNGPAVPLAQQALPLLDSEA